MLGNRPPTRLFLPKNALQHGLPQLPFDQIRYILATGTPSPNPHDIQLNIPRIVAEKLKQLDPDTLFPQETQILYRSEHFTSSDIDELLTQTEQKIQKNGTIAANIWADKTPYMYADQLLRENYHLFEYVTLNPNITTEHYWKLVQLKTATLSCEIVQNNTENSFEQELFFHAMMMHNLNNNPTVVNEAFTRLINAPAEQWPENFTVSHLCNPNITPWNLTRGYKKMVKKNSGDIAGYLAENPLFDTSSPEHKKLPLRHRIMLRWFKLFNSNLR